MIFVVESGTGSREIERISQAIRERGSDFKSVSEDKQRLAIAVPDGNGGLTITDVLEGKRVFAEETIPLSAVRGKLGL